MGTAAYKTQIKKGGTAVSFAEEPLINYGNNIFRIEDPIKRVLSLNHNITLINLANNSVIVPIKVNYLEGFFQFPPANYSGGLEVSAHYIPLSFIGGSKEYTLELAGDVLDDTSFHDDIITNEGYRSKVHGLTDVSLSFSRFSDLVNDLRAKKIAEQPVYVRINPGNSKIFISGWFIIETLSMSGDVGGLEEESLTMPLYGNLKTSFSYIFDYTNVEAQALSELKSLDNYFIS